MSEMKTRFLGRSGVEVSTLCLGTMMFGGPTEESEAARIIDHARDHGVNFIDTANVYEDGRSEEIAGRAIRANRDHWVLATKVGFKLSGGINGAGLSRRHILHHADQSLSRLGVDHIDIYYIHTADPNTPFEDSLLAFDALIRAGKIRYLGVSNLRAWQITHVAHLCHDIGMAAPAVVQPYYNLMNRQPEVEVIPAAREFGLGVVPYSPIARGILSGKYAPASEPPKDSRVGRGDKRVLGSEWREESLEIATKLKAHAEAKGHTLIDFAVAWVLNNDAISSVIAGPRTFSQWESYFGANSYEWTQEDEELVDSLVAPGHPSKPGYSDPNYPLTGRFSQV